MLKFLRFPLICAAVMLLGTAAQAQAPQAMNYQGIARDASGKPLQSKSLAVRISVLAGGSDGQVVYTETHRVATTDQGSFSLAIGRGKASMGKFTLVEWGSGNHFLRVEMDPTGGTDFRLMGTSELLSVPYAFHAGTASQLSGGHPNTGGVSALAAGVPAQTWNLFGNSNVNSLTDRIGTTDAADFVMITNNLERLTITKAGKVAIRNDLSVGNDLTVNRNVELNILGGATINNGPLTVAKASATALTGTLNVTGATNLASTLNAVGATTLRSTLEVTDATNLKSTLNAAGATTLGSTLGVTGATSLASTLGVTGATNLSSSLGVTGATTLGNNLQVAGATTLNNSLAANGQVTINTSVSGGQSSYGAYPLRVEGSGQGIAIKLNEGTPNNSNNFITFFNSSGGAIGRIEGQTSGEAKSTPEYIVNNTILAANVAAGAAKTAAAAIPVALGPCGPCIAMAVVDVTLAAANLASYDAFAVANLGVTYQSGSADYAEWLERSNISEKILPGDIVAVNGGKISKFTGAAQQLMVISTKPAMLGNMPPVGQEAASEKVAFMGQIPVKVRGIVFAGDYILPSGLNDGTGIGVSPKEIKTDQYKQIVGVAWSQSLVEGDIARVNMAIGLNSNDLANLAVEQEKKIKALEGNFASLEGRLFALEGGSVSSKRKATFKTAAPAQAVPAKELTRDELLAKNMPAELSDADFTEALATLKDTYAKQGVSISAYPNLNRLFTDAPFQAEVIRKAREQYKVSYQSILARTKQ